MNKKVNRVGKSLRQFIAIFACVAAPTVAEAECVVAGTDFNTKVPLCNPSTWDLDENGWFSDDLGDNIADECGDNFSTGVTSVIKKGFQTASIQSGCSSDFSKYTYDGVTGKDVQGASAGYAQVVGNPKLISPFLADTKSGNVFVQGGTGQGSAILTYSVSGLEANSKVTLSCSVTNLLDEASIKAYFLKINEGVVNQNDLQKSLSLYGYNFSMQSNGAKLTTGPTCYDQKPQVSVLVGSWETNAGRSTTNKASFTDWGETVKLVVTGYADGDGNITFSFGRVEGGNAPIAIDNIEIKGNIAPKIVASKNLPACPANPITLSLDQTYPDDALYEWKGLGKTSEGKSLVVTPEDADQSYPVTCKVTMGACVETATLNLETKKCCSIKDPVSGNEIPQAETYIFFEDFGKFVGEDYIYKDRTGVEHSIPIDGYVWNKRGGTQAWEPASFFLQDGVSTPNLPSAKVVNPENFKPEKAWVITPTADYCPEFREHTEGSTSGGMFFFDLQENSSPGDVIYEREITDLCPGKEISFSAYFSSANNNPATGGTGELSIRLMKPRESTPLYEKKSGMLQTPKWIPAEYKFTADENTGTTLILQVVNLTENCEGSGKADFLLDDITFSVCTPPDVEVESSLTADELLDLCTEKPLTLTAQISETAKEYYKNQVGYLFQYTYDDPTKEYPAGSNKPEWKALSEIQLNDPSFTIDKPANHIAFADIVAQKADNVFFRVVIAREDYLKTNNEWQTQSALSPCREVSISQIPIIAALKCDACTNPNDINIKAVTADGTIEVGDKTKLTKVKLCKGQSVTLTTNDLKPTSEEDIKSKDFKGFIIDWYKGSSTTPEITTGSTAATVAPENVITYKETDSPGSFTWTIVATDFDYPDGACSKDTAIIVEFLDQPSVDDLTRKFCEGKSKNTDALPISETGKTYTYFADEATATAGTPSVTVEDLDDLKAVNSPISYWYTLKDENGCVSEPKEITITVNANPAYNVPALDVDPFCKGQYDGDFGKEDAAKLPAAGTDANGDYSISWKSVTPTGASTALNSLEDGSYNYTYVVKNTVTECETEVKDYEFKVNPAAVVALSIDPEKIECGKTTVNVSITPAEAAAANPTVTYDNGSSTPTIESGKIVLTQLDGYKSGNLKVSVDASATYCAHSDDIDVTIKEIPGDIVAEDIHCYLKSDKANWKDVQNMANCEKVVAVAPAAGQEIVWRKKGDGDDAWTTTAPNPTSMNVNLTSYDTDKFEYEAAYRDKTSLCVGKEDGFVINVYAAPAPEPKSPEYCKDATNVKAFSDLIIKSSNSLAGVSYDLYVYDKDKNPIGTDGKLDGAGKPDVTVAGEYTYYARQYSTSGGYSDYVPFTVTVREAKALTIDDSQSHYIKSGNDANLPEGLYYCKAGNETPTAIQIKGQDNSSLSYGVEWSNSAFAAGSMVTTLDETAISKTPNLTENNQTYYVRQYYKITQAGNEAYCVSDGVSVDVYLQETSKPTVNNVTYLLSEFSNPENPTYPDLDAQLQKKGASLITDADAADYTYYYCACDESGTPDNNWETTVPKPTGIGKSDLNGKSKDIYYAVKRVAKNGAMCESDVTKIKVTISDSPMPTVDNVSYCEGFSSVKPLSDLVHIAPADGKAESDYVLLWIKGTAEGESHDAAEFESLSDNNTIDAPDAKVVNGEVTKYVYYIAQKESSTGAIGAPAELVITVVPNPSITIDQNLLVTPCEKEVQLENAIANVKSTGSTSKHFFQEDKTTEINDGVAKKSGNYYVQAWLDNAGTAVSLPVAGNEICYSKFELIEVTIDSLSIVHLADSTTCPDSKGHLNTIIKKNVATATYKWSSNGYGSAEETTADSKYMFETKTLVGNAGDKFLFDLEVSAGACSGAYAKKKSGVSITLDDGPVVGKLTLAEPNNLETGKEYEGPTRDHTGDPFYTCGYGITATANFTIDDDASFTWKDANGSTVASGATTDQLIPGTYTLEYSNQCPTFVKFTIEDASINNDKVKLTSGAAVEEGGICEKDALDINLSYQTNSTQPATITWQAPSTSTLIRDGQKSGHSDFANTDMSGVYSYSVKIRGCEATGSIEAKVKPYIQFNVVDVPYTTINDEPYFVARRDSMLDIELEMIVPSSAPNKIEWFNVANETVAEDLTTYTYQVKKNKETFHVVMSDDDYCNSGLFVSVVMDGRLVLKDSIAKESICKDDATILYIDTTGTGNLFFPNLYSVNVVEKVGEVSRELSDSKKKVDNRTGVISYEISPKADATYKVTVKYREDEGVDEQSVSDELSLVVLQKASWQYSPDYAVCANEELTLELTNVQPAGDVIIKWDSQDDIVDGNIDDTESIVVAPTYDESKAKNHKFTKRYAFTVLREGCEDKRDSVPVKVWEPITGSMNDTIICEGFGVRLNATNYQASTYEWTTPQEALPVAKTATAYVIPERTAYYIASMTRGECKLVDSVEVTVNSKPQINLVDSTGIHQLTVSMEPMNGTAPFMYRVDNGEYVDSEVLDSVAYHHHVIYVMDAVGCMDTSEYYLNPPTVKIPIWFSPNGDGEYDRWEVPTLTETYPSAEIKIFDRWGKLLVRYKGSEPGWDGTYNGQAMPSTDYWYEIHIREIDTTYTGHFTLMRR